MTQTQIEKYEDNGRILVEGSDSQFEKLKQVPLALDKIFKNILKKEVDYGTIPGTPKPSLWKPGAELLANYFGLVASDPVILSKVEDRSEKPYFEYVIMQRFYRDGVLIGAGEGAANTRETRYGFRWLDVSRIPKGLDINELEAREKNGWKSYKVPTPADEVYTLQNTVLKMAKKRAFIDGILSITGASRIFTQDIKEESDETEESKVPPSSESINKSKTEKKPGEQLWPPKSA